MDKPTAALIAKPDDLLRSDLSRLSDDRLEELFDASERMQEHSFLMKCKVVATYRTNHKQAWGESWIDQANERFHRSRRTLLAYANLWEIYLASEGRARERFGALTDSRNLMAFIGRKRIEDGNAVLRAAAEYMDEYGEVPSVAALRESLGETGLRAKRKFGPPLNFRELRHEPINEQGVVLLFGIVANDLGFLVEAVTTGFPDCTAKRKTKGGHYELVNIEFEFKASNALSHKHDLRHCDLVVCWENDWPDCPLEVIELKEEIKRLPGALAR